MKIDESKVEAVAEICHEANRLYCLMIGDESQPAWIDAPDWQKASVIKGINNIASGEVYVHNPEASHNSWMKEKLESGWKYGEVKDVDKKEHPCLMPYKYLSKEQKLKDSLFAGIVNAMLEDEIMKSNISQLSERMPALENGGS